nr:Xaa-Pro peptidase family protein [Candidatus Njordarchaeota archaeon]
MEPIGFNKDRVSQLMRDKQVDVLLASSPENVFYTSGLPTRHSELNPILYILSGQYPSIVVISQDGGEALITWQLFRSVDKVSWIRKVTGILSRSEALERLFSLIKGTGLSKGGTIGVESLMPYYMCEWLTRKFPDAKIKISDDIFTELRLEKSEEEIRRIRQSTKIAEKAIQSMIDSSRIGVANIELVKLGRKKITEEGMAAVDHITVGVGGSDPEYPWLGIGMEKGDLVLLDVGAVYGGYCSDVARYAAINPAPEGAEAGMNLMIKVQQACIDAIGPGVKPIEAVNAAYETYNGNGGEGFFFISIHSVGLLIEEYTFYDTVLGASSKPFKTDMVIDVDCRTVVPPQGLIGVGDPFLVTRSGCERISTLEKKMYTIT